MDNTPIGGVPPASPTPGSNPGATPNQPISLRALLAQDLTPPPLIVEGLLFEGENLILGAPSKVGKSFFAIAMAICVAHGLPFHGYKTTKYNVLYINFELNAGSFGRRVVEILKTMGVEAPENIQVWNRRGEQNTYHHIIAELRIFLKRMGGKWLIIVDPLYMIYGGDMEENALKDFQIVMNAFDQLGKEVGGTTVVVVHHFPKGDFAKKDVLDRMSGTGGIARRMDDIATLSPHEEEGKFVFHAKTRDQAQTEAVVLRWEFPVFVQDSAGADPLRLRGETSTRRVYRVEDVLEALAAGPLLRAQLYEALREATGMSLATAQRLIGTAFKSALIYEGDGKLLHSSPQKSKNL
jgi:hypothetical protein